MARISTYVLDTTVSKNDKIIGTDSSGNSTKNFKLENIAGFLNTSGLINLNGVVNKFIPENTDLSSGFFKLPSGGTGIAFSSVTSLKVSINNLNNINILEFYNHLVGQGIKISNVDNINEFGQYVLAGATQANPSDTFVTFSLSFLNGNGSLRNDNFYLFNLDNTGRTDKNFVTPNINFTAGVAHTVSHNLFKFPAVTTVDSAGSHIVGEVQHIDNNNFNITFKASFQGKVYVN
jgi:hypothetical protein